MRMGARNAPCSPCTSPGTAADAPSNVIVMFSSYSRIGMKGSFQGWGGVWRNGQKRASWPLLESKDLLAKIDEVLGGRFCRLDPGNDRCGIHRELVDEGLPS